MREAKPQVSHSFVCLLVGFVCFFFWFAFVKSCMIRPCQKFLLLVQLESGIRASEGKFCALPVDAQQLPLLL